MEEALQNSVEALGVHLYGLEEANEFIPEPSQLRKVRVGLYQTLVTVKVYMPLIREAVENKSVKTTVTMPKWMKDVAEREGLNLSQLLQESITNKVKSKGSV
jgi:hypothetical protein